MRDLDSQLRDYIDGTVAPIAFHEVTPPAGSGGTRDARRPSPRVLAAVVALLAVVAVVGVAVLVRGGSRPVTRVPGRQPPGVNLTSLGPADCSSVTQPGDTVILSVLVTGGHSVCVTEQSVNTTVFFDGRQSAHSNALAIGAYFEGGIGTDHGRLIVVANMLDAATAVRLAFCNGQTLDLRPLNTTNPRFVAGAVDTKRYGLPGSQQIGPAGIPLSGSFPASSAIPGSGLCATPGPGPSQNVLPPAGKAPLHPDRARRSVTDAFLAVYAPSSTVASAGPYIDDPHGLQQAIDGVNRNYPEARATQTIHITEIRFISPTKAAVQYDYAEKYSRYPGRVGIAVLVKGRWRVTRATVCADIALGGVQCPS